MLSGEGNVIEPYIAAQQIRYDFMRSGALPGGGVGEGAWVAGTCEMLVDGSGAGGIAYSFGPPAGQFWVIDGVNWNFVCLTGAALDAWGTIGNPLANGILLRLNRVAPAETTGLCELFVNADFGKLGRCWMDDNGVTFILNAQQDLDRLTLFAGDTIQAIIRDDMTVLGGGTTLSGYAKAHVMR